LINPDISNSNTSIIPTKITVAKPAIYINPFGFIAILLKSQAIEPAKNAKAVANNNL